MKKPSPRPPANLNQLLRGVPTKWVLALIVLGVAYTLAQPWMNRQWGWNLPSLASFIEGDEPSSDSQASNAPTSVAQAANRPSASRDKKTTANSQNQDAKDAIANNDSAVEPPATQSKDKGTSTKETNPRDSQSRSNTSRTEKVTERKKYGILEEIGSNRYRSPEGLIYAPGSQEGHRLAHIERHLTDQPDRPGSHGVFDGDMEAVLTWIDEAYRKSKTKAKGTTSEVDSDGRTVIDAKFDQAIGYVGGRDGQKKKNPPAKTLRLVLDEKNVITAFPK